VIGAPWISAAAAVLLAASMALMLPRGAARGRLAGAVLFAAALGLFVSQIGGLAGWVSDIVFYALALATLVGAAATVTFRNPIYCAVWFGLSLLGVAGLFLVIGAQFLAAATVIVYAGAILVTFLFVLMLAQPEGRAPYDRTSWEALVSAATGAAIVGVLSMAVGSVLSAAELGVAPPAGPSRQNLAQGVLNPEHVARLGGELFGQHLIAVEVAGTLLLAALVGAVVIAAQERAQPAKGDSSEPTERPAHSDGQAQRGRGAEASGKA
jgi:NADH-quinone oxidoreductase subunit J